jgi:Omp85 superfamily domain
LRSQVRRRSGAQTPAPAPPAGDADERRAEKSTHLEPYAPGGVERFLVAVEQRYLIERIFDPPRGVFTRVGGMPEGQGITAGPAYRYSTPAAAFTATSALSMFGAWEVSARVDAPRGKPVASAYMPRISRFWSVGGVFHRLPQEDFWGLGQNADSGTRTDYLLDETTADVTGGLSPARWFTLTGTAEYRSERPGKGKDSSLPDLELVYGGADAPGARIDLDYVRLGGEAHIDVAPALEGAPVGGRYSFAMNRYIDRNEQFSFNRWEVDLQQYLPIFTPARLLALRAHAAGVDPDAGHDVPFYLQPALGGDHSLRGSTVHRFRSRNALLLQAEYRFALNDFISGALFYDAGKVAFHRDDLGDFDDREDDYGFSLRFGFLSRLALRAEVAFGGNEGTVIAMRFGDVF